MDQGFFVRPIYDMGADSSKSNCTCFAVDMIRAGEGKFHAWLADSHPSCT